MKNIVYGLTAVLTSDEAADAVLDYAAALAHAGLADTVAVPTVDAFGVTTTTSFLLAPALGILIEDAADDPLGPDTTAFVEEISWRARAVRCTPPTHE